MVRLRVLGTIDLRGDDGAAIEPVLRQPKRLALLTWLAAASDGELRRRDVALAMFWPESDDAHARSALSGALAFLRRSLGPGVMIVRGEEEVGCDRRLLSADLSDFVRALEERRDEDALGLYGGDLLPGLHVAGAAGFEEWLERERARLREMAARSAAALADRATAEGDKSDFVRYAARAAELAPDDESMVQRLIRLRDAAGDRAGALRCYESFAARLRLEHDAEPSPETKALAEHVRGRSKAHLVPDRPRAVEAPSPMSPSAPDDAVPPGAEARREGPARVAPRRRRLGVALALVAATAIAVVATRNASDAPGSAPTVLADVGGSAPAEVRRIVGRILAAAFEDAGTMIPVRDDDLRQGLATMLRADTLGIDRATALELAYRGSIRTVVEPELDRVGGVFSLSVRVLDAETGDVLAAAQASASDEDRLIPAVDEVAAGIHRRLGARRADLAAARPHVEATTASFDAYRRLVLASNLSGPGRENETRELLREALAIDSTFAMAWSRLAQSWANTGHRDSMLAALAHLERHHDRGSEYERLMHRATIALLRSDYAAALPVYERLVREHGPAHLNNTGLVLSSLGRHEEALAATRGAIVGRAFGPLPAAVGNQRNILVVLGRVEESRRVTDSLLPHCGPRCSFLVAEQPWFTILQDEWTRAESLAAGHPHPVAHASLLARRGEVHAAALLLDTASTMRFNVTAARLLLTLVSGLPWERQPTIVSASSLDSLVWRGVWEAVAGDTVAARSHSQELRRLLPGRFRGAAPEVIDAAIARRAGRWRDVVDLLGPAAVHGERGRPNHDAWISPLPIRWMVADAYDSLGMTDSAIVMYEHVLHSGGGLMQFMIARGIPYPAAHEALARLYAGTGRHEASARHGLQTRAGFRGALPPWPHPQVAR